MRQPGDRRRTRPAQSAAADRARLRYASGRRRVDPAAPLFAADSVTRRVNREAVLLLGGGRALLMQIAHPLVAAGVAAHSHFERAPLQRLWRTLDLTLTIVFGSAAEALAAVRNIERRHAPVHGRLAAARGPFRRGTRYDANAPELQLWVHATLVDSALLAYQRFVAPLTAEEQARFYDESRRTARLFGIPAALIPSTLDDFRLYWRDMLRGPTLTVGPEARAIAAALLSPPLPFGLRQLAGATRLFTIGLLPPRLRARYGYDWGPLRERTLDTAALALRAATPLLPVALRRFPQAR
ncbi:MAG: oxygenase MpaB family protein [Deltaproteobacteria bacterium]|nr:oxygenase MpaB family protein [Deltaproteobacteria bacterium]